MSTTISERKKNKILGPNETRTRDLLLSSSYDLLGRRFTN